MNVKHLSVVLNGLGDVTKRSMDRRSVTRLMVGAGAAVVGGATLVRVNGVDARSGDGKLRTTTSLNLRAQPNTSSKVLLVLPKGAVVTNQYAESNGFIKVGYQGTTGWAYGSYLVPADSGDGDPTIIGQGVTKTAVNFRTGPSTSNSVLRVLPKGTTVEISDLVRDGFRYVVHQGQAGWIADQYLAPAGGEGDGPAYFTTTTAVNLRAKPSTSASIVMVVPKGATVADYDLVVKNGFRGVAYKGKTGWIAANYLV